jgi:hypothetical protein
VTFSDALAAVRRWLWVEWVFVIPGHSTAFATLNRPVAETKRAASGQCLEAALLLAQVEEDCLG